MYNVRESTNKVIELAEEDMISWKDLAIMCLHYMSEDDVKDMVCCEALFDNDEDGDY